MGIKSACVILMTLWGMAGMAQSCPKQPKSIKGDNAIIVEAENVRQRLYDYLARQGVALDTIRNTFGLEYEETIYGYSTIKMTYSINIKSESLAEITGIYKATLYKVEETNPVYHAPVMKNIGSKRGWDMLKCLMKDAPMRTGVVAANKF